MFSVEKAQRATEAVDWGGEFQGGRECVCIFTQVHLHAHSLTD